MLEGAFFFRLEATTGVSRDLVFQDKIKDRFFAGSVFFHFYLAIIPVQEVCLVRSQSGYKKLSGHNSALGIGPDLYMDMRRTDRIGPRKDGFQDIFAGLVGVLVASQDIA